MSYPTYTPDEAKELWCPVAHPYRDDDPCRCMADKCMAWRWGPGRFNDDVMGDLIRTGYCGLAGKP